MRVFENMVTLNPKYLIITIPMKIAVLHLIFFGPFPVFHPMKMAIFRYTLGQSPNVETEKAKAPMRILTIESIEQSSPK